MNDLSQARRKQIINIIGSGSKGKVFACIGIIAFMAMMLAKPDYYLDSARRGLALFATSVLPSLFPFYFFSLLLTYIGAAKTVSGIFQKPVKLLYNAPKESAYVLLLSMLSGYPVGASMTAELFQAGKISEKEAKAISAFASTSGPIFMLGTVGSAIFGDVKVGAVVLAAHYIAALLNGLIFRVRKQPMAFGARRVKRIREKRARGGKRHKSSEIMPQKDNVHDSGESEQLRTGNTEIMTHRNDIAQPNVSPQIMSSRADDTSAQSKPLHACATEYGASIQIMSQDDHDAIMSRTIANSTINMLFVGGYIVLCGMLADTLALLGAENLLISVFGSQTAETLTALLYGLIEMTRGSIACAECELRHIGVALCAAIVSFGGLSVMLQNYTFLSKCNMRFSAIAIRKLCQSLIAFVIGLALSYLL